MRVFALCLALVAGFQGDEDKIAKLKAPQVLAKAQPAWAKRKGCHFKAEIVSALLSKEGFAPETIGFEGTLIRDFAAFHGSADLFARGREKLIKGKDGLFAEPVKTDGQTNRTGVITRNPSLLLADLFRFSGSAVYGGDEKIGEFDCRIIETAADERSLLDQVKEVTGGLKRLEAFFIKDLTAVTDRKKSTSVYQAWISRTDFTVARIDWTLTIVVNKKNIPFEPDKVPDQHELKYSYTFSKFDTELQIDVPPAVKSVLGAP